MNIRGKFSIGMALAGWGGLCLPGQAEADPSVPPGADARYLLQDNDEHIRAEIGKLRLRQLQREEEVEHSVAAAPSTASELCLPFNVLRLSGATLLQPGDLSALNVPNSSCLDRAELQRIVHALNALYLKRGYIAARVLPETTAQGALVLNVIEGQMAGFSGSSAGAGTLFPGMLGHPLNIRDLEQGLDQANRLLSQQLRAEVLPGARLGDSMVHLSNRASSPWHGGLSLGNRGYDSTGRRIVGVNLGRDNPSGYYDFLSVSLDHSLAHERYSRRGSLFYSLPYGYWTFSSFVSQAEYLNRQKLRYHTVSLSGFATQGGVRAERVLERNQTHIDSSYLQISHKRVQNYFLDSLQQISSPTLSVAELGLSRLSLLPGAVLSLEAALEKGMPWFGATRDAGLADERLPRAQYLKAKVSASARQALTRATTLDSRVSWQGSRHRLPAIEQLELADNSMVRGFRHYSLTGDTGWIWHNTLVQGFAVGGVALSARFGLDVGRVLLRDAQQNYQSLAGAGVGLALTRSELTLDLEYNRPLYSPQQSVNEPHQLLARLFWQF